MVNVLDMDSRGFSQEKVWEEAFRVSSLFLRIEPTYCDTHTNGSLHLDCNRCQQRFKELAYRIFEELCEAADAHDLDHKKEEIADAVLFTNLLFKLVNLPFYIKWSTDLGTMGDPLINLGLMTNCLKLRPWRRQYSEVDIGQLKKSAERLVESLASLVTFFFKDEEDFLDFVDRKVQVNEFRFNSKY